MEKEEAGGEMLEYSIVDEKKVPAEMTERIAGMEETPFQIMYVQGDRLYVGQGYGRQEMEGYAIRVDGCTEEKDVICVQTTLLGPRQKKMGRRWEISVCGKMDFPNTHMLSWKWQKAKNR